MSITVHDLRCPDGHIEINAFVENKHPEPCWCGLSRTVFYATREQEGQAPLERAAAQVGTFRTVRLGGETLDTKEKLDRHLDRYCAMQNVSRSDIALESTGTTREMNSRHDDMKHEAIVTRRVNGYDEVQFREHQRESGRR